MCVRCLLSHLYVIGVSVCNRDKCPSKRGKSGVLYTSWEFLVKAEVKV